MSETLLTLEAVCRVWKSGHKNAILIFPKEINPRNYTVDMWEEVGQHGEGDPFGIIQKTRPATEDETAYMKKIYERHYQCKLIMKKRINVNWRP